MRTLNITICLVALHLCLSAQIGNLLRPTDGLPQDKFGRAVDLSGDFAIVGAHSADFSQPGYTNAGAVYIYHRIGNNWEFTQKLWPNVQTSNMAFGYAVAIDGHVAIIGAVTADGSDFLSGAAYIFTFNGSYWSESATLVASDGNSLDFFGISVDIDGNKVVVGAPRSNAGGSNTGAAYFYRHDGSNWGAEQKVVPSDNFQGGFFGRAVSISGDRAAVGAPVYPNPVASPGKIYTFEFDSINWTEQQIVVPVDGIPNNNFGHTLQIDDDQLIATSPFLSANYQATASAYVFNLYDSVWFQYQKTTTPFGQATGEFGVNAAIEGDIALVGVHEDDAGAERGAIYIYRKQNGVWGFDRKVKGTDFGQFGLDLSEFGSPLAIDGHHCIAGVLDTTQTQTDEGMAMIVDVGIPENRFVQNARTVICGDTVKQSTIFYAFGSAPDTCFIGYNEAPGLWYQVTGTGETMIASLCGSNVNTKIGVFVQGTPDLKLMCIAGNDNHCGFQSSVAFATTNLETYYIYVSAIDTLIGNYKLVLECSPPSCSEAPVTYTDQIGLTTARLNWEPEQGALRYEINGGVLGLPAISFIIPATFNKFIINNLQPGATYYWRIRSICDLDQSQVSPYSTTQTFTTPLVCNPPGVLWSTNVLTTSARLNWITVPAASWYRISGSLAASPSTQWIIDVNDPNVSQQLITGLAPGFTYKWSIQSYCGPDPSVASPFDTFSTPLFAAKDGLNELPEVGISLHPNPAKNLFTVVLNASVPDDNPMLRMFDPNGKEVHVEVTDQSSAHLIVRIPDHIRNGVYLLQVFSDGKRYTKRLVVLR